MHSGDKLFSAWESTHHYVKVNNYIGYNKHDALNSPILNTILSWHKWSRIVAIQTVMRAPINLRPVLMVRKAYNPKGLSLFLRSLLTASHHLSSASLLTEAEQIIAILENLRVKTNNGWAWGYQYPWQDPGFFAPTNTPNAVVTAFVCKAYMHAFQVFGRQEYLARVKDAIAFFLHDLITLKDTPDELCLSYMPMPMDMRVMDVSILIGSVIADYQKLSHDMQYSQSCDRLINYVVAQQTPEGAWFYTDPPSRSHIRHDNYHTGFILDALFDYMQAKSDFSYQSQYNLGLKFYANNLFMPNGAPKWMSDQVFPYDIHGAAQGIITFSRHQEEYPGLAHKIADWTLANLYSGKGYFYYQKTSLFTKRFTLMRWCNAWMCLALSTLLFENNTSDATKQRSLEKL